MKRIVIVGGGFSGVYAAQALERRLRGQDDTEILLFSRDNYFVFQPMLPEVISGGIGLTDVVSPLRRLLRHTHVHVREVESIDIANQTITAAPGFRPHAHQVKYDHLVLAPGTVTDFRGLPGLPEHALPFKDLGDALKVRSRVIQALEEADVEEDDPDLRRQLLTFVVAGGGFSGVEVAAELNDFVRHVARHYRRIDPKEIRVVLVHSGDDILPELAPKLRAFASKILRRRGVELALGQRLKAATGESAILSTNLGDVTAIPTKTLISTIPSSPHPLIDGLKLPKTKNGRLQVDGSLRVVGYPNVWALGDCASVPTRDGTPCPPTAQHATRQAATVAENIVATLNARALRPFDFKGLGKMGSLGRRNAVAEVFGLRLSGFIAWFLWRTIYLAKLPGWGRRIKVATAWTLDLFLQPELVELRLGGGGGAMHEHFEPGQYVFSQGELGDRVYILLSGKAEVVRTRSKGAPGGDDEQILATLGPGECFGEMALLDNAPRNASVRCVQAMTVLSIPKREFGLLAANVPGLRANFEHVMARRGLPMPAPPPVA